MAIVKTKFELGQSVVYKTDGQKYTIVCTKLTSTCAICYGIMGNGIYKNNIMEHFLQPTEKIIDIPTKFSVPGTVAAAILLFLAYGDATVNKEHNGYYSKGGWPYDTLERYIFEQKL